MFNRRRGHPILGTALVVGASRASARQEVERQASLQAQQQLLQQQQQAQQRQEIERQAELKKRQDEETEERVKKAVAEALQASTIANASAAFPPGVAPVAGSIATMQIGAGTHEDFPPPPTPLVVPPGQFGTPQNSSISPRSSLASGGAPAPNIQYCAGCGNGCDLMDLFCRRCGRSLKRE
ncbi:hypothetical protein OQA88_10589 [Cercophora sp. LCS_1]